MQKARIREDGLAALVFWPSGDGFDKTALFLDGMPYVPMLTPLAEYLVSRGYGVVIPQYFGTFDSDGVCTPESAVETVFAVQERLAKGSWFDHRGERQFNVGADIQFAAAHSYGTNVLFEALLRGFRPPAMVLQSPFFLFGSNGADAGAVEDLSGHVRQIVNALPHTFRVGSADQWFDFFVKKPQKHPEAVASSGHTNVLCVVGGADGSIDASRSEAYARTLQSRYPVFDLLDYMVVEGAGHDQAGLMSPSFQQALNEMLP